MRDWSDTRARLAAATPGEWEMIAPSGDGEDDGEWWVMFAPNRDSTLMDRADAELIAHAPTDIADLLAENTALRDALDRVKADMRAALSSSPDEFTSRVHRNAEINRGLLGACEQALTVTNHALADRDSVIADLRAALDRVIRLHQPMPMWKSCSRGWHGCGERACVETLDGGHVHNDQRDGTACSHCCDEDGEPVDYPCATARAAAVVPPVPEQQQR